MTFKRTTPITALDLDSSDMPDAGPSSKGGVTTSVLGTGSLPNWFRKLKSDAANAKLAIVGDSTSTEALAQTLYSRLRSFHTASGEGLEGMSLDQYTDAATTNASATLTSATATFTSGDVGISISGTGIPAGSYISAFTNSTTVTLSNNATATATGVTITLGRHIINSGSNGASLQAYLTAYDANTTTSWSFRWLLAKAPDLIILSFGINDIRLGSRTQAQLQADLVRTVDIIRAALPSTDIVLRMPNTLTSDDFGGAGYVSPNASAQAYSDSLRNAYLALQGNWPNVAAWNAQDRVFGRTSRTKAATDLMTDQLHPSGVGYTRIADALVGDVIGYKIPFAPGLAKSARDTTGYWTAHTTYARAIEDPDYNQLVAIGEYVTQTSASVSLAWPGDAASAIQPFDVIEFGAGAMVIVIPSNASISKNTTARTDIGTLGSVPANTFTAGTVRVWRRKYGDPTIEGLRQSGPGRTYIKTAYLRGGGSGYMDLDPCGYDTTWAQYWDVQKTDSLYVQGVGAVSLASATIAPQGGQLRILVSGDYTSYIGNQAIIYSSHPRELPVNPISVTFDAASVAATATSDQTVTVQGATTDCGVIVTPPSGVASGLTWAAWGSAANTVTIRFNNPTAGAIDLSSGTWKFRIVK